MFNEDCICPECKGKEMLLPEYAEACRRDADEIKNGNPNFKGIGYSKKEEN